jgi:phage terminase large subunit
MTFIRTTAINKILQLKKRKKVIQGGTSAGKTFGIIPILIDRCCKEKGLEVSVVSESVPHLKRGALKDFLKIMRLTNRFNENNYNKSDRKYTFSNGSFIEFFSPESILGARRDVLYINECNRGITFYDYHQLSIRTAQDIYLDYNPANPFWVQAELMNDDDVDFLILTYKDNEALSKTIIDDIEKAREKATTSTYWENWWKVYGLGLMGSVDGVVFEPCNVVKEFPADCKWVVFGMDFGYSNDPTTLIKVGMKDGELYFDQLLFQTGLTNSDLNNQLKILNIGRGEIVADSSDAKSIAELKRWGWNIRGCVKGKDSIVNGIDLVKRYKANVTEDSLDLLKEWRGYSYVFDNDGNKFTNYPVDDLNHTIDAIRYACSYKIVQPIGSPKAFVTRR